jgi:hypothetical protein
VIPYGYDGNASTAVSTPKEKKMTQMIARHIIIFKVAKKDEIINLDFQTNSTADMAIPFPGDEVELPQEVATKAGFSKKVFKVISRRFLYHGLPAGIAGAVVLILSQD